MNFKEALIALQAGKKITRNINIKEWYLCIEGDEVKSHALATDYLKWDNNIILSHNWIIEDEGVDKSFYEAIDAAKRGKKIRLPSWGEGYAELDKQMNELVFKYYIYNIYTLTYQDFNANDWEILN